MHIPKQLSQRWAINNTVLISVPTAICRQTAQNFSTTGTLPAKLELLISNYTLHALILYLARNDTGNCEEDQSPTMHACAHQRLACELGCKLDCEICCELDSEFCCELDCELCYELAA